MDQGVIPETQTVQVTKTLLLKPQNQRTNPKCFQSQKGELAHSLIIQPKDSQF